ncbi:hypothetical protein FGO68_gene6462 [Halteria grandinella]|uniref:Uncharacterized protein n=1 Tax=Halteria grandinella TaxID=5974 RepID=A0A8J8NZN1_HALGN|nr:hypothetical protein FGO68_gene6462 [Halteria grandinella]
MKSILLSGLSNFQNTQQSGIPIAGTTSIRKRNESNISSIKGGDHSRNQSSTENINKLKRQSQYGQTTYSHQKTASNFNVFTEQILQHTQSNTDLVLKIREEEKAKLKRLQQYEDDDQAKKRLTLFRRHSAINLSNTHEIVKDELCRGITESYANQAVSHSPKMLKRNHSDVELKLPGMVDRVAQEFNKKRFESTSGGSGGKAKGIKHPTFEYPLIHFSVNDPEQQVIKCSCPECEEERLKADQKMDALAIFESVLQQKKQIKKQLMLQKQHSQRPQYRNSDAKKAETTVKTPDAKKVELCKLYSDHKWKQLSDAIILGGGEITEAIEKSTAHQHAVKKVFKNFAEGKPLKRFDVYMDEELGRRDLKKLKVTFDKELDDKYGAQEHQNKLLLLMRKSMAKKVQKQVLIQQQLANITQAAKQLEATDQADEQGFMKATAGMKAKNHEFLAIKQAVDTNQMSLTQANELIFQKTKKDNKALVKGILKENSRMSEMIQRLKLAHSKRNRLKIQKAHVEEQIAVSSPKNIQIDVLVDEANEIVENFDCNSPESIIKDQLVDTFELSQYKQKLEVQLPPEEDTAKSARIFTRRPQSAANYGTHRLKKNNINLLQSTDYSRALKKLEPPSLVQIKIINQANPSSDLLPQSRSKLSRSALGKKRASFRISQALQKAEGLIYSHEKKGSMNEDLDSVRKEHIILQESSQQNQNNEAFQQPEQEQDKHILQPLVFYGKDASAMILSRNSIFCSRSQRGDGHNSTRLSTTNIPLDNLDIKRSSRNILSRQSHLVTSRLTQTSQIERKRYANYQGWREYLYRSSESACVDAATTTRHQLIFNKYNPYSTDNYQSDQCSTQAPPNEVRKVQSAAITSRKPVHNRKSINFNFQEQQIEGQKKALRDGVHSFIIQFIGSEGRSSTTAATTRRKGKSHMHIK